MRNPFRDPCAALPRPGKSQHFENDISSRILLSSAGVLELRSCVFEAFFLRFTKAKRPKTNIPSCTPDLTRVKDILVRKAPVTFMTFAASGSISCLSQVLERIYGHCTPRIELDKVPYVVMHSMFKWYSQGQNKRTVHFTEDSLALGLWLSCVSLQHWAKLTCLGPSKAES